MALEEVVSPRSTRNGLRHRKKEATRQTLVDAALLLFTQKGFGATSVDEIAAAAAVSRSTFFRYFGSKEAVLFAEGDARGEALVRLIAQRPGHESPFVAFEESLIGLLDLAEAGEHERQRARMSDQLFRTDPLLRFRRSAEVERWKDAVAIAFARRKGHKEADAEDCLASATCIAVTEQIGRQWIRPDGPDAAAAIREAFALLRRLAR